MQSVWDGRSRLVALMRGEECTAPLMIMNAGAESFVLQVFGVHQKALLIMPNRLKESSIIAFRVLLLRLRSKI